MEVREEGMEVQEEAVLIGLLALHGLTNLLLVNETEFAICTLLFLTWISFFKFSYFDKNTFLLRRKSRSILYWNFHSQQNQTLNLFFN